MVIRVPLPPVTRQERGEGRGKGATRGRPGRPSGSDQARHRRGCRWPIPAAPAASVATSGRRRELGARTLRDLAQAHVGRTWEEYRERHWLGAVSSAESPPPYRAQSSTEGSGTIGDPITTPTGGNAAGRRRSVRTRRAVRPIASLMALLVSLNDQAPDPTLRRGRPGLLERSFGLPMAQHRMQADPAGGPRGCQVYPDKTAGFSD